jgi:hypothetical protein
MGNRLSKTDTGGGIGGTESYSYNSANMLLTRGVNTYTTWYVANGNTLTGGGRTNTWDSANRLVQCVNGTTTSTFTYAADGIRHRSVVNGTTFMRYILKLEISRRCYTLFASSQLQRM